MVLRGDYREFFSVYEYGPVSRKIVYLFGGWMTWPVYYKPLVRLFVAQGYECVLFIPKRRLVAIGSPYQDIVTASRLVIAEVQHRIQIDKQKGTREFVSFGVSLGTLFASELAKSAREVQKLVLLSPFGDFGAHVDIWPSHRYFSKILASQPTNRQESGEVLNQVGIGRDIEKLRGKRVFVGYTRRDTFIHTHVIEDLIRLINRSGVELEVATVRGGHIRGLAMFLATHKGYRKFLFGDAAAAKNLLKRLK
jgi:pimeloyl-ACP methyl ester carboxylesterase